MSVKVEVYQRGERLDCSISRAGRRVKWTIHRVDIFQPLTLTRIQKKLIFVLNDFYINSVTYFIIYVNFKMALTTKNNLFRCVMLSFESASPSPRTHALRVNV